MWFWWFMLCCDMLIPIVMIGVGRMMWKHPPEKINGVIGYRTTRSMKNKDTWKFAHTHSGKLWWKIGWITLLPSLIVHIPFYGSTDDKISIVSLVVVTIQIILLVGSIFPTERALKNTFTDDGGKEKL